MTLCIGSMNICLMHVIDEQEQEQQTRNPNGVVPRHAIGFVREHEITVKLFFMCRNAFVRQHFEAL